MAWGGSGGQVDRIQKTGKSTVKRAVDADKKKKDNAAEIAKLKRRIARGGMMMKRGNMKQTLERRIRQLEGGGKKKTTTSKTTPNKDATPNKSKLKTPAQAYTAANKDKPIPKHRKNSKKSWLDRAWGR